MQVSVTCPDLGFAAVSVTVSVDSLVSEVLTSAAGEWDVDTEEVELSFAGDTLCEGERLADRGVGGDSELEMWKKRFRIFSKCWFVNDSKREKLLRWIREHNEEYLYLDTTTFTEDGCLDIEDDLLPSDAERVSFRNSNSVASAISQVVTIGEYFLSSCSQITWDHDTCLLAAVPDDFDRGRQDGVKRKGCEQHQHQPPHQEHPNTGCFLSNKERNRLAHALNGNGGTRKDSRDRRPRDDTRDRDEDRTDKEERRLAKLEKEKLESLDEIEEEKQRLGQQRMAMEQHHHQKETNLQGQEKQLEQQRQHQQQELQSQYHQQQQQLQSHHQLKETESLQKEQNLQAQLKEQHQHQQKDLEKQYRQRQQQLESQQQKKDAESEQQAHLTRSQLQKEKESFQTEKERLHLQLDQQLRNEKDHLHRKLKEQIGQEKVQQQQKLQQKEDEIQRREEEVNRGQQQLHQQQQQLEQQQQQSQHQQLELQQQRQQQQQQHQQLELEQQQLQQQTRKVCGFATATTSTTATTATATRTLHATSTVCNVRHLRPAAAVFPLRRTTTGTEARERGEKRTTRDALRTLHKQLGGLREEGPTC